MGIGQRSSDATPLVGDGTGWDADGGYHGHAGHGNGDGYRRPGQAPDLVGTDLGIQPATPSTGQAAGADWFSGTADSRPTTYVDSYTALDAFEATQIYGVPGALWTPDSDGPGRGPDATSMWDAASATGGHSLPGTGTLADSGDGWNHTPSGGTGTGPGGTGLYDPSAYGVGEHPSFDTGTWFYDDAAQPGPGYAPGWDAAGQFPAQGHDPRQPAPRAPQSPDLTGSYPAGPSLLPDELFDDADFDESLTAAFFARQDQLHGQEFHGQQPYGHEHSPIPGQHGPGQHGPGQYAPGHAAPTGDHSNFDFPAPDLQDFDPRAFDLQDLDARYAPDETRVWGPEAPQPEHSGWTEVPDRATQSGDWTRTSGWTAVPHQRGEQYPAEQYGTGQYGTGQYAAEQYQDERYQDDERYRDDQAEAPAPQGEDNWAATTGGWNAEDWQTQAWRTEVPEAEPQQAVDDRADQDRATGAWDGGEWQGTDWETTSQWELEGDWDRQGGDPVEATGPHGPETGAWQPEPRHPYDDEPHYGEGYQDDAYRHDGYGEADQFGEPTAYGLDAVDDDTQVAVPADAPAGPHDGDTGAAPADGESKKRSLRSRLGALNGAPVAVMGVAAVAAAAVGGLQYSGHSGSNSGGTGGTSVAPIDGELTALRDSVQSKAVEVSRSEQRQQVQDQQAALAAAAHANADKQEVIRHLFVLPVSDYILTAGFGQAGEHWASVHTGQDFAVPIGTPVHAVEDGVVISAGWAGAYGYRVVIQDADGTQTWYCHLSGMKILSGPVKAGDVIAYSGNTGNTTGPHLHFEVRIDPTDDEPSGTAIDPLPWLRSHGLDP